MKTGGNNNVFINYYIYDVARLLPTDETVIRQSGDMNIEIRITEVALIL